MIAIRLIPVTDFAALGEQWRDLEARAHPTFFQTWTWTGCLAAERFDDPILAEATEDGQCVALALFNRRRKALRPDTLWLGESGVPTMDRLYIEGNGVLTVAGREAALAPMVLRAARAGPIGRRSTWPRHLVLSGVTDTMAAAAVQCGGAVWRRQTHGAPCVDLAVLRRGSEDYFATLSANTRQQIRRSDRGYANQGNLALRRAETAADAHRWLDAMIPLHQATWTRRREPGCFADPFFARFHHALIDRGMERGEIDLLRITAGTHLVGVLYNFRYRGCMLAYQSGFDYPDADPRLKPGLTCHHLAIRFAAAAGLDAYDFLAGDTRYKRSLSNAASTLHWLEVGQPWSARTLWRAIKRLRRGRPASLHER